MRLDGRGSRQPLRLSTAGLPFHQVRDGIQVSPDQTRLSVEYAVTEGLTAVATWDTKTGALLWVGPPAASVLGDWVLSGGRAYIPSIGASPAGPPKFDNNVAPVILVADIGTKTEVTGGAAWLLPGGDEDLVTRLSAALQALLADPLQRQTLAAAAHQRGAAWPTADAIAERYEHVYRSRT